MHQEFFSEEFKHEHSDGDFILVPEIELDIVVMCPICELTVRLEKKKGPLWKNVIFEEDNLIAKAVRSTPSEIDKFRVHYAGRCEACSTLYKTFFPTPRERQHDATIKRKRAKQRLEKRKNKKKWKNRIEKYQ
jgi:hypothetical protein